MDQNLFYYKSKYIFLNKHICIVSSLIKVFIRKLIFQTTISRVANNDGSYVINTWSSETGILINEFRVSSGPLNAKLAFAHKGKVAYIVGTNTGVLKVFPSNITKNFILHC